LARLGQPSLGPRPGDDDPLPVLGRDKQEDTDLNDDDKDRRHYEHRARWVLDERAADAS
jgi:hypothetical protein